MGSYADPQLFVHLRKGRFTVCRRSPEQRLQLALALIIMGLTALLVRIKVHLACRVMAVIPMILDTFDRCLSEVFAVAKCVLHASFGGPNDRARRSALRVPATLHAKGDARGATPDSR